MHDDFAPPDAARESDSRYRTIEFADGLVIFDRRATAGWIHADQSVSLAAMR
jgi:hypothetical protein